MAERIRVLIADDHPVVRQGLRTFLSSRQGLEVVAEAADGAEAVRKARHLRPDVVLLDLQMPEVGGLEALTELRGLEPAPRVLVLTSFSDADLVMPAVRGGAAGYLLKDVDPAELEAAVRTVADGGSLLHPEVTAAVLAEVSSPDPAAAGPAALRRLTPREAEVLALIAEGLTNRRIARRLGVAEKTVKTHVSNVLAKLGLGDRTQAALYAVRHGVAGGPPAG